MSVIQKIRDKYAAIVITVIALSLVSFILMDAFVGRSRGLGRNTSVGKINGEGIERVDFEKKITMQQQMYGGQGPQREQLIGQVWDQQVDQVVMQQELDKLGMRLTAKEFNDVLFGANPPQWMQQQFTDPKTKVFDVNAAKQAFLQIKKQKASEQTEMIEQAYLIPTQQQTMRQKYMALISGSTYVPKWLAEKALAEQSSIAKFSYVTVPYASLPDSSFKVSDDDIKAYINKHKANFQQEEASRSISYVAFNASPSADDTAKTYAMVMNQRDAFATAPDMEAFLLRAGSETPYTNSYTSKLTSSSADTLKKLGDGQVFGPYVDGANYVLAKMIGRRTMPDSVKVRHILIKTGQGGKDDSTAKKLADSIMMAAKGGANFDSLVVKYSDDPGSKEKGGVYDWFPQGQMVAPFNNFAFEGKEGDKGVVKTDFGYHYMEILGQKNFNPAYKIAYFAKPIEASQQTINNASNQAAQFSASSRTRKQFDENVTKQNLTAQNIADVKKNDFQLPGVGDNRSLVRWVYENKTGDVSEPFEVNDKYIVAVITGVTDKGLMSVEKARPSAEPLIITEKKAQQIINTKFKSVGNDINQVASAAGVAVQHADSVSFAQPYIMNVGNEPKIVGAAFNKGIQGKVSPAIAGNVGVYVLMGEGIQAIPNTNMTLEAMQKQMESQAKQMGAYRSAEALKKAADVQDNRFDFY